MNLLGLHGRSLNLDLVIEIVERTDPPGSISVEYAFGQVRVLEGNDAEAMRCFLRTNTRAPDAGGTPGVAPGESPVTYALDRREPDELLPGVAE